MVSEKFKISAKIWLHVYVISQTFVIGIKPSEDKEHPSLSNIHRLKVVLAPTNLMISQCRSFKQSSNIWLNRDGESLPAHCSSPTVFSVGLNRFPGLQNHELYNSTTIHLYSENNYIPKENCLKPRWWMSEDCWHKKTHEPMTYRTKI